LRESAEIEPMKMMSLPAFMRFTACWADNN